MIIKTTDLMIVKNGYMLFSTSDSFLHENLANDSQTLHTLFQAIFDQASSSKSFTIYLINILSSVFSVFPSQLFHFLKKNEEILYSIGKCIDKCHIFTFISNHFCKSSKGFQFMMIVFENLLNENNISEEFRKNSLKILIQFLHHFFCFSEFEDEIQDSFPLLYKLSQNQQEQKLIFELALSISPSDFLIDICHSIFTKFTISSPLIESGFIYYLYTESLPSTNEIELFLYKFFDQDVNQNLVHSFYNFLAKAIEEDANDISFKNHLNTILFFQFFPIPL
jgi:hypothetical protein